MQLKVEKELKPFQMLVCLLAAECRRRGLSAASITRDEIVRMCSTVPAIVQARKDSGWQWFFPDEEQERLTHVVWYNLHFFEQPIYVYAGYMNVVLPVEVSDPTIEAAEESA